MSLAGLVAGKRYTVLGLGVSGAVAARELLIAGAEVLVHDDKAIPDDLTIYAADLTAANWSAIDALVLSPGIPHTWPEPHPVCAAAKAAGVPLISDVELLVLSRPACNFIGITGTNGKSTTTALVGHILQQAGVPVSIGGNLGPAALSLPHPGRGGWHVLELSSYQCELIEQARFQASALLNFSPDHEARHGGLDGYLSAKKRLLTRTGGPVFLTAGHPVCEQLAQEIEGAELCNIPGSMLRDARYESLLDLTTVPTLQGPHNEQNAAIAFALAKAAGVSAEDAARAIATFPGLAHRQELLGNIGNVLFVNDSKATNADATAPALQAFSGVHWLLGGQPKPDGIDDLLSCLDGVTAAYCYGAAGPAFAQKLEGLVPVSLSDTLDVAVRNAFEAARSQNPHKAVVLLSPACASWDQFDSFEHRGDSFRAIFDALKSVQTPD